MEIFSGGEVDRRVMENSGCLNYSYTPWVSENSDISERAVYYKFEKHISSYKGEVTSTQQRSPLLDGKGWVVEEVLNLHGVPLGDYFNVSDQFIFVFNDLSVLVIVIWFSSPVSPTIATDTHSLSYRGFTPKSKGV
jgi:hypothetical protein